MNGERIGPPAAQQPPEGQKSGRHTDYTNGSTRHSGWSAMQRRRIAALRSEPLPWTGRRDPDNPLEGAVGFLDRTGRRHSYWCACRMCFHAIVVGDAA